MKMTLQLFSLFIMIMMLCSCTDDVKKSISFEDKAINMSQISENNLENTTSNNDEKVRNLSTKKVCHSYGVAKNGVPHEISENAQKYFEENNFDAYCLDTKTKEKVLYLTFDCGYENGYTNKILDILKEKQVPSAFFCTLPQVKENKELVKRMIDEGHIVGNHSVTHPSFAEISKDKMINEVKTMDNYLKENFNYSEPFFRFPKGEYNEVALNALNEMGYSCVFWSLAYSDWNLDKQMGSDKAYNTVISRLHPGAVILLHSVSPDNTAILGKVIDYAKSEGYEFRSLRDYPKK